VLCVPLDTGNVLAKAPIRCFAVYLYGRHRFSNFYELLGITIGAVKVAQKII